MANETISPNMNLPVPGVGLTDGPQYAIDLNSCLSLIDSHNHASGQGVPVNTDGLNINADLTIQSNNLTNIRSARFTVNNSPLAVATDLGCVYVSGVDLYYNDVNGNQVRITQSGGVAGSPGSISNLVAPASASYVALSSKFVWQSAALTAADMDFGSAIMRNGTASSYALTLSPPTLSSNYSITLPTLPVSQLPVFINSSGTMATRQIIDADVDAAAAIARSKIANQAVTTKTATYGITTTDDTVLCDSSGGTFTVTLYTAVGNTGKTVTVKKTDTSVILVTIATTGGQTIDGASTKNLATQNEAITLQSNGTNWVVLNRTIPSVWTGYSPTIGGFGTVTTLVVYSRRVGQNLEVRGRFTAGTVTGAAATIALGFGGVNGNVVQDSAITSTAVPLGVGIISGASSGFFGTYILPTGTGNDSFVYVGAQTGTISGQNAAAGNLILNNGNTFSFLFSVPIVGWEA